MTRTKSSRALLSVVLAVLMAAAFMPSLTYSSFAATAKKATKVTKASHADKAKFTRTVGTAWTLKYKLSPSKLTSSAKKVTWKSSNSKVAKITTIKSGKAVVSFKSVGKASVTVYTKANKKAKATWNFTVVEKSATKKVAVTSAAISAKNTTVAPSSAVKVGTVLTADVAPTNATGVKYSWTVDGKEVGTDKDLTVTTDMIGKKINLKVTDDSNTAVTEQTTAVVSDATLYGVKLQLKDANGEFGDFTGKEVAVGDTLKVAPTKVTGVLNDDLTKAASIKWIRTTYSANGTAVDTTVAENTDTYTVTRADLAAKQNGAKVSIKAEVTPNTGVKAYGMTNGKFVAGPVNIKTTPKIAIYVDGKDVTGKRIKSGSKLTAVTTPSDVQGTYVWYGPDGVVAGANTAELTATKDGVYRVHFTPSKEEKDFDRYTVDAEVKVGGKTLQAAVLGKDPKDDYTKKINAISSIERGEDLYVQGQLMGESVARDGNYNVEWYVNGVKITDAKLLGKTDGSTNHATISTSKLSAGDVVTAKITGIGDYLGDTIESNPVTITGVKYVGPQDALTAKLVKATNGEVQVQVSDLNNMWLYEKNGSSFASLKNTDGTTKVAKLGEDYTIEIQLKVAGDTNKNVSDSWKTVGYIDSHNVVTNGTAVESVDPTYTAKDSSKTYRIVVKAKDGKLVSYNSVNDNYTIDVSKLS